MMCYLKDQFQMKISPSIEKEMQKIISSGNKIKKIYVSKAEAIRLFSEKHEIYKVDIIKESKQKDNFQIYAQENSDFFDLCYGPHLPSLKHIGAFKLTKVAGAYWKGIPKMKCYKEYMVQHGKIKKI